MVKKIILFLFLSFLVGNTNAQDISQSDLIKEVNKWLGTPYVWGGKTKNGIDCSQFNKMLQRVVYGRQIKGTCSRQWKETERIKKSELRPGDLVFFYSKWSPSGWHCGTYIGDGKFAHSSSKKYGVTITKLNSGTYGERYKGAGRIKK